MYQLTIEDIERSNSLAIQPGRTAFIDECGRLMKISSSAAQSMFSAFW